MNATEVVRTVIARSPRRSPALQSFDRRDRGVADRLARVGPLRRAHRRRTADLSDRERVGVPSGIASLVAGPLRRLRRRRRSANPVTAFKDKLNYKQPGGAGFSHPPGQGRVSGRRPGHVDPRRASTIAVSSQAACGCRRRVDDVLPVDERGVVRDRHRDCARLVRRRAGGRRRGVHRRAGPALQRERTAATSPRRVLVASYAPDDGAVRRERTTTRSAACACATTPSRDGRFRISTLADFDGAEVATDVVDRPLHPFVAVGY